MSKVAIVTDSTAYIPAPVVEDHRITVIPLTVNFDDGSVEDGLGDLRAFFDRVERSAGFPVTSQPPLGKFIEIYERLISEGKEVISVHISSKLSGTCETARTAAGMVAPEKISVIDSQQILGCMGFLVLQAAERAAAGQDRQAVVKMVEKWKKEIRFYFVPATLEYLRRGGRIGGAEALLGTLLQIRPVLCIKDGQVEVLAKVRTWKRAIERILQEMPQDHTSLWVGMGHGLAHTEMLRIANAVKERAPGIAIDIWEMGPVIGLHIGPGAIGVAYWLRS